MNFELFFQKKTFFAYFYTRKHDISLVRLKHCIESFFHETLNSDKLLISTLFHFTFKRKNFSEQIKY